ncbi:hypothetical protein DRJ16_07240 [Candidatus Woesearchaeota archaeon]|nr:MAG: hypothetical protein DRJ16_07240 [Candidatus Woesearchaeota archaeon]
MVNACPPTHQEKCKPCRLGYPCHVHDEKDIDYKELAKKKRRKKTGRKKGKKRISKGAVEKAKKAKR